MSLRVHVPLGQACRPWQLFAAGKSPRRVPSSSARAAAQVMQLAETWYTILGSFRQSHPELVVDCLSAQPQATLLRTFRRRVSAVGELRTGVSVIVSESAGLAYMTVH